jgi:hypothetical protein
VRTCVVPGGLGSTFHFTQHSAFGYVLGYHYSALRARFSLDPFHTRTKTCVLTQTLTPWAIIVTRCGLVFRRTHLLPSHWHLFDWSFVTASEAPHCPYSLDYSYFSNRQSRSAVRLPVSYARHGTLHPVRLASCARSIACITSSACAGVTASGAFPDSASRTFS